MRKHLKLVLSLSVLMLMGSVSYAFNEPTLSSYMIKRQVGDRQDTAVRVVKLVRFDSQAPNGPDVASGDALVWDTLSDDGVSVRLSTTSGDSAFAGIALTAIQTSDRSAASPPTSSFDDIGRRNWGYILVSGMGNAKVASGAGGGIAAGDLMIISGDSGAVGIVQPCLGAITTACTNQLATGTGNARGFFLDAGTSSGTSIEVYVRAE